MSERGGASADSYFASQLIKAELEMLGLPTHGSIEEQERRLIQAKTNVTEKRAKSKHRSININTIKHELDLISREIADLSMDIESGVARIKPQVLSSTRLKTDTSKTKVKPKRVNEWISTQSTTHSDSNMVITRPLSNPIQTNNSPTHKDESAYPVTHNTAIQYRELDNSVRNGSVYQPSSHKGDETVTQLVHQLSQLLDEVKSKKRNHREDFGLPIPEPTCFDGNPLSFSDWNKIFKSKVERDEVSDEDRLVYLKRYCSGKALKAINSFCDHSPGVCYSEVKRQVIDKKFGNSHVISQAYVDKLLKWSPIADHDTLGLEELAQYLVKLQAVKDKSVIDLSILDNSTFSQGVVRILPKWLIPKWRTRATKHSKKHAGKYPDFKHLVSFLAEEAETASHPVLSNDALFGNVKSKSEKTKTAHSVQAEGGRESKSNVEQNSSQQRDSSNFQQKSIVCSVCGADHNVSGCKGFSSLGLELRYQHVLKHNLCRNCLKRGHPARKCFRNPQCETCPGKHHSLLHNPQIHDKPKSESKPEAVATAKTSLCGNCKGNHERSLCTMILPVYVATRDAPDKEVLVYCMLDSMSNGSYITADLLGQLNSKDKGEVNIKLSTMTGDNEPVKTTEHYDLTIRGYYGHKSHPICRVYARSSDIPHNRDHIPTKEVAKTWSHLSSIIDSMPALLDCPVGLMLGYDNGHLLAVKQSLYSDDYDAPNAVECRLGWSIIGNSVPVKVECGDLFDVSHNTVSLEVPHDVKVSCTSNKVLICNKTTSVKDISVGEMLKALEPDFQSTDLEDSSQVKLSQQDQAFLQILDSNVYQDDKGFVTMPLPFKQDRSALQTNRYLALGRFRNLERKLSSQPKFRKHYCEFMQGILERNEAERVPEQELNSQNAWYLPHHGVYHPKKPDKLRVVFDGSAQYHGQSLNDQLMCGPDLNNSLVGVLSRFRLGPVAVSCDVEKMFHRFMVTPIHRNYLRFLWYDDSGKTVDYRMKVHIFGATSSPACAKYGLNYLASKYGNKYPDAQKFIQSDFYVDDGLTSRYSADRASLLLRETMQICSHGNLNVHKLLSNDVEVLKRFPKCLWAAELESDFIGCERALGVSWDLKADQFVFSFELEDHLKKCTRRSLLSLTASIYDPLGLIAPLVLPAKIILQESCVAGYGWDDHLDPSLVKRWNEFLSSVRESRIVIPRCISTTPMNESVPLELHTFCDACETGYGCCVYAKITDSNGKVQCHLLFGKSRVVPKKSPTIPRLELQSAVLAAKSATQISRELSVQCKQYFWSDSTIALGYITNKTKKFSPYVTNRTMTINALTTSDSWGHVRTAENPADIASRGASPTDLEQSMWFNGPAFLYQPIRKSHEVFDVSEKDPELKDSMALVCNNTMNSQTNPLASHLLHRMKRFSDWRSAVQSISGIIHTIDSKFSKQAFVPSVESQRVAEQKLYHFIQVVYYASEISILKGGKFLPRSNPLTRLDPFLDDTGLLRVGGRVKHSESMPYSERHPVILPNECHCVHMLVRHHHVRNAHQGRSANICALRLAGLWIVSCRKVVDSVIRECVCCRRTRRPLECQKMADLPSERVDPSPPFTYIGCDVFGPFLVRDGRKQSKRYGLLFTCLASRAIHIEVLDDMSADCFLNSLRCLIAIRGPVRQIRCDQGTNFVGGSSELRKQYDIMVSSEDVSRYLLEKSCEFLFNSPSSSHMGGVWERQIRSARNILSTLLSRNITLDSSSLRTIMYEVMSLVNSRPLGLTQPDELEPLTPNHILHMKSGIVMPPPGVFDDQAVYSRKRWLKVQSVVTSFWNRWRIEYISNLQVRSKWQSSSRNVQVGDIVIIQDDDVPRSVWKMGRVMECLPSRDGHVRRVKLLVGDRSTGLKTKPSVLERPIHKLVVLVAVAKD